MKKLRRILAVVLVMSTFISSEVFAIGGVYHNPYGIDGLYNVENVERFPRDPIAGESVYVKTTTWPVEDGQSTWISWELNGNAMTDIGGNWKYNEGNNTYWEMNLGNFEQGDVVKYTIHANQNGADEKIDGPYEFTVVDWENITQINSIVDNNNGINFMCSSTSNQNPIMNLSFKNDSTLRLQVSPNGSAQFEKGTTNYTITDMGAYFNVETSKINVKIEKNPYHLTVLDKNGETVLKDYNGTESGLKWLTDGTNIITKTQLNLNTPANEAFFGFGEHYNKFNKRGSSVNTYVFNQYKNQNDKTYMAIPFMLNSKGYGLYDNSTYYSKFDLADSKNDLCSITTDTGGSKLSTLDMYIFVDNNLKNVVSSYTDVTGKAVLPPKEAFGVWMSANEWDRESEVYNALDMCKQHNIPASVVVLEQWSDEKTFYIFNDATYNANDGSKALRYSDYTFNGKWTNPKAMVDAVHKDNMKLLLWQVPLLKATKDSYEQNDNDRTYMENNNYAVKNGKDGSYKIPDGKWFSGSYLLDFTNPDAINWWMSKRDYLVDDIGIDGFKTDGGEMLWGRDNVLYDGTHGDEMRNKYPNKYTNGYYSYAKSKINNPLLFSRSGTAGIQSNGLFWSGDQESTFYAFDQAIVAGLTANMSGVPFMGWDLSGFTGSFPNADLYKRSLEEQAFSPIMQFHSEKSNPSVSEERSPWNVAARNNDNSVIDTFRKYANMRYNLMPYIYSEAKETTVTGEPLMEALALEYSNDINTYGIKDEYLFGDNILVAPITTEGSTSRKVYLPEGEWIDLMYGSQRSGKTYIDYHADVNNIPLFVKSGEILPMNLNNDYEFGGNINNDLYNYNNLTFRIYPNENSNYGWFDDLGSNSVKNISVNENSTQNTVTIDLPSTSNETTLQIFTTNPSDVVINNSTINEVSTFNDFKSASNIWYYDTKNMLLYIKINDCNLSNHIVINGTNKVGYQAEYATLKNVTVNTNHSNYISEGFIDNFAEADDEVIFDVYSNTNTNKTINIRYSAAIEDASRNINVNGVYINDIVLTKTNDWDTWEESTIQTQLHKGKNEISIKYGNSSHSGINLDEISITD